MLAEVYYGADRYYLQIAGVCICGEGDPCLYGVNEDIARLYWWGSVWNPRMMRWLAARVNEAV